MTALSYSQDFGHTQAITFISASSSHAYFVALEKIKTVEQNDSLDCKMKILYLMLLFLCAFLQINSSTVSTEVGILY